MSLYLGPTQTQHPAFVLSLFDTGCAVARSLNRAGIEVVGFDFNADNPGFLSNCLTPRLCPDPELQPEALVVALIAEAKRFNHRPVLYPASDAFVGFVSEHREKLAPHFLMILPEAERVRSFLSKNGQSQLAQELSLPHPAWREWNPERDQGTEAQPGLRFPFLLKPTSQPEWQQHFSCKAVRINAPEQLAEWTQKMRKRGLTGILQELIDGPLENQVEVSLYRDSSGQIPALMSVVKRRVYPDAFGLACRIEVVAAPELEAVCRDWMSRAGIWGYANIEFKQDARDGVWRYIETNIRVWQQIDLTDACARPFALLQYCDLTGQAYPFPTGEVRAPAEGAPTGATQWVDPMSDFYAWSRIRSPERSLVAWWRSIRSARSHGLWNHWDWRPVLKRLFENRNAARILWILGSHPVRETYRFVMRVGYRISERLFAWTRFLPGKRYALASVLAARPTRRVLGRILPPRLTVYTYHRIAGRAYDTAFDEDVFGPLEEEFAREIRYLKQVSDPISESDLLDAYAGKIQLPRQATLVTFDDGYKDNYTRALPILKSEGVSAIFFIPTHAIDEREVGWWDLIAWMVKRSPLHSFTWNGHTFRLEGDRIAVIRELQRQMKLRPASETLHWMDLLSQCLHSPLPTRAEREGELMTWEDVRDTLRQGFAIGSHTVTHRVLATLDLETQRHELRRSREILEERTGARIRTLAYPVGGYEHFSLETKTLAQEAGYEAAFSFRTGFNTHGLPVDRYDIRRAATYQDLPSFYGAIALPALFSRRGCEADRPAPNPFGVPGLRLASIPTGGAAHHGTQHS